MDTSTTMIGLFISALCALPFILMYANGQKKKHLLTRSLGLLANNHAVGISKQECNANFIMGIDHNKHCLLFFQSKQGGNEIEQLLDLSKYRSCRVVKTHIPSAKKGVIHGSLDKLELSFQPKDSADAKQSIVLFDSKDNVQLGDQIQFAERWVKIINQAIDNR